MNPLILICIPNSSSLAEEHDGEAGKAEWEAWSANPELQLATDLFQERERMRRILADYSGVEPFKPAFWILIDLFVNHQRQRSVAITSACIACGEPSTTALRYISILVDAGLTTREHTSHDARYRYLQLTRTGFDVAMQCLRASPLRGREAREDRPRQRAPTFYAHGAYERGLNIAK
ncbi:hypothetical protein MKP08_11735 [Erythrobacter sp. LQ02-29]|uniref:hypothetical protein n=1 Tax=Erythrobacter sp. LQ02-29 TaxID=2920384 RepID=UPI00211AB23F|nr:hypothetical protein [Erythrobacter sp. LQ02-29]MCP9223418.1 hypothetical protein [Erythrobacter sp. LQ02-29]